MTTFTTIAQLEAAETKDLIVFYNSINSDKPIKKFADRQSALKRCTSLLPPVEVPLQKAKATKVAAKPQKDAAKTSKLKAEEPKADANKISVHSESGHLDLQVGDSHVDIHSDGKSIDIEIQPDGEKKYVWPFKPRGEGFAPEPDEIPSVVTPEAKVKKVTTKQIGHHANAAGIAASWNDPTVRATRLKRDGVSITLNGVTTEYKSIAEAFRDHKLNASKYIRFRLILKAERKAIYTENGVAYQFAIV